MKHLITLLSLWALPLLLFAQITTPTVINIGGGLYQAENLAMSYSIGEAVIPTLGEGLPLISQGFEQPDFIMTIDIIDSYQFEPKDLNLKIFPNPTSDWLVVSFDGKKQNLEASIWNGSGQLLVDNFKLEANNQNLINLESLVPGIFFIRLEDEQKNFAVFQFIKINL